MTDPSTCPKCGHMFHEKECWNMASDNDCDCPGLTNEVRITTKPDERTGRIADTMFHALTDHPEYAADLQVAVFISTAGRGAVCLHKYNLDEGTAAILTHINMLLGPRGLVVRITPTDPGKWN